MNRLQVALQFVFGNIFETIVFVSFLSGFILRGSQLISENVLLQIVLFGIAALVTKWIYGAYLNFMLTVRQNKFFDDNRSVQFLNFDAFKFLLIAISLFGVIYLGVNKVLNNETIATLLGGLIGSLLTMKGSYTDLKYDKEDIDKITKSNPPTTEKEDKV